MATRMRAFDWRATPLGAPERWPLSLRTVVGAVLTCPFPMIVLWGPEFVQLYNDGYSRLLGARHPTGLGQPNQACWPEVWSFNEPLYRGIVERGESYQFTDQRLTLWRNGAEEEAYFTLGFSPVRGDGGQIEGVLVTIPETSERVLAQRELQQNNALLDARTQALEEERAALGAFVRFTETAGQVTDIPALAQLAIDVFGDVLPESQGVFYERRGDRWWVQAQSPGLSGALKQVLEEGLPLDVPAFAALVQTRAPVFVDQWHEDEQGVAHTALYQTVALYPIQKDGQVCGALTVALKEAPRWSDRDRSVILALGRSVALAHDRVAFARQLQQHRQALQQQSAELELRNRELQASNDELEAFTYSASHDLRTPVRHVQGFAELALKALHQQQPEKVSRNLGLVKDASHRMTALIDAMLLLSRAGRQVMRVRACPLGELVARAQQDVSLEYPGQRVEWEIGPLPSVQGDPVLLQQVLTNLVSNAVKFSCHQAAARVRIWAEQRPEEVVLFVRDHGAGFNMAYADKLFVAFQRLHNQTEFAGTGIGLATVRRIVTRHGGRIWAEAAPGQGATFAVALPGQGLWEPPTSPEA